MTEEHKLKISMSNKGKSRNNGKIWITNGYHITRIFIEEFNSWELQGYRKGKKLIDKPQTAWNKGLKATQDSRVARQRRVSKIKIDN